jgi:hypothetical protein
MENGGGERFLLEALREAGFEVTHIETRDRKKVLTIEKTAIPRSKVPRSPVLPTAARADLYIQKNRG